MQLQLPPFRCFAGFHLEFSRLQLKESCDQYFPLISCAPPKIFHNTQQHTMHKTNLDSH